MNTDLAPKPKRKVTFEVDEREARQISGYIQDAFEARINTPYSSAPAREVAKAFSLIAEGK